MAALDKMGVPAKLVRAMHRPATPLVDWSIEGVTGKCPSARAGWLYEIVRDKLYVYGGCEDPAAKEPVYFDEVYCLDMPKKTWTRLYSCGINAKLAKSKFYVFCDYTLVAMAVGAAGSALEVLDELEITPMLDAKRTDFKEVMTKHVTREIDEYTKALKDINRDLALGPDISPGDLPGLEKVMAALKTIKDQGMDMRFTLDQLQEALNYMELHQMGKVDKIQKKLDLATADFTKACDASPAVTKSVKPLRDAEAAHVREDIEKKAEALGEEHKAILKGAVYKIATGSEQGYTELLSLHAKVSASEVATSRLVELAKLFEFPELAEDILAKVRQERQDLIFGKALWDLFSMVDAQIAVWKKLLWDDIKPSQLEEESKAFQKIVKGMDKSVRTWDVYLGIDAMVKNFQIGRAHV